MVDAMNFQDEFKEDSVPLPVTTMPPPKTKSLEKGKRWHRNWLCFCGSNVKYKSCCEKKDKELRLAVAKMDGTYMEPQS